MITLQDSEHPFVCEICRMDYDANVAMPFVICKNFHIACHNCLQRLTNQSDTFKCPFCRLNCGWKRVIEFKFLLDVKTKLMRMTRQQEQLRSKNMQLEARNNILSAQFHQMLLSYSFRDAQYCFNYKYKQLQGSSFQWRLIMEEKIRYIDNWCMKIREQANNFANITQHLVRQLKCKNQKIANLQNSLSSLQQQYNKKSQSQQNDRKEAIKSMRKHYRQRIRNLQQQAKQASRLRMANKQLEEAVRLTHHVLDANKQSKLEEKTMSITEFLRMSRPVKVTIDLRQFRRIQQAESDADDSEM